MPAPQHYRQADDLLSNVLGADAADQQHAFQKSLESLAKLFELAEAYQDHVFGTSGNATSEKSDASPATDTSPDRSAA